MSEKKRFEFYSDDYLVGIIDTATGKKLNHFATMDLLNEQDKKVRQLEKSIERREEQISIIKKHCEAYLTEEQYKTIKEALSVN